MFNFGIPEIDWSAIMPILIVAVTGILALILEMLRPKKNNELIVMASLVGLSIAALSLVAQISGTPTETFADMLVRDRLSVSMQLVLVIGTALCILFSEAYLREKRIAFGEFYALVLWSTVGGMLMASTKNLLMVFIGLEILSVSLYVMAGMSRTEERSEESALKYFLLGAFASGFLLYGIAFIYGATGTLHLDDIGRAWLNRDEGTRHLLLFGLGLLLIGLGFKASFVPFHQWTPDVYQGAPTNVTAFMATGSKIGAFAALWRVLEGGYAMREFWMPVLSVIAVLTMIGGNVVALLQKDVKRILGYSSISHAGYVLVAILAHAAKPGEVGSDTITYYLLSYTLMTIGAFAVISLTARKGGEGTTLDDLNGLWQRSPLAAASLVVFVASLIGLPPTSGFLGKGLIFFDALRAGLTPLAIVLAVSSVISLYYYLGIIRAAVVGTGSNTEDRLTKLNPGVASACVLCVVGVLGAVIFFGPLMAFLSPK
jgi:NADH-quinone oxidoreductase subunit N